MMSVNDSQNHKNINGYCPESYLDGEQNSTDEQQPNESLSTVIKTENGATEITQENLSTYESTNNTETVKDNRLATTTDTHNNHNFRESRSRKFYGHKNKYGSMSPNRPVYYSNGHHFSAYPCYYYATPSPVEKPTPLMFIPTPNNTSLESTPTQVSRSSTSPTSHDQKSSNASIISSQTLPPRLRQQSLTENDSNQSSAVPNGTNSTATTVTTTSATAGGSTSTNHSGGRRTRSILSRNYANYYAQHPPPPLMATPPGVLYPYPPTLHPGTPIAYNIGTPEELDYYAYASHCLGIPPAPLLWPSPTQSPLSGAIPSPFPIYPIGDIAAPGYIVDATDINLQASLLNPEANEWVPIFHDINVESVENEISLDNDVDFPPLNSGTTNVNPIVSVISKDLPEDNIETTPTLDDTNPEKLDQDETIDETSKSSLSTSDLKSEETVSSTSSQDDTTQNLHKSATSSSSTTKATSVSYSTVILQTSDNQNMNKDKNVQSSSQRRQVTPNQQSTTNGNKERPTKSTSSSSPQQQQQQLQQQQQQQQQTQQWSSSTSQNTNSRRRQSGKTNRTPAKTGPSNENSGLSKALPQQATSVEIVDEWIEVKSKKTKKFDRNVPEISSDTIGSDERTYDEIPLPIQSPNAPKNITPSSTSEDDLDVKDQKDVSNMLNNNIQNDYHQNLINNIHCRLKQDERLVVIMRGCPGSGKSTLARSINDGFNGVILSTDDFFEGQHIDQYIFDVSRLDEAHRSNQRRTNDAIKRNINPIIIDNTNTQAWEMRPYIAMGVEAGYSIVIAETQTPWRYKARELAKRNCHNVPLKRIKDMINNFEHDVNVQRIIDQLPQVTKVIRSSSTSEQTNAPQEDLPIENQSTTKKTYEKIEDSSILEDVRLCIDDMIMLLTSQFYQTALSSFTSILTNTTTTTTTSSQSSTPLSVSFHDLSLLSPTSTSLPSTPTTSHVRFHRPMNRFSSTATQDHSYFADHHHLRFSSTLNRCLDSMNSSHLTNLSTQPSILGKKRRKPKSKLSLADPNDNEILVNTNNNNNNMDEHDQKTTNQPMNNELSVYLAEECPGFVVVDERNENDWLDQVHRNFGIQMNQMEMTDQHLGKKAKPIFQSTTSDLINIIHQELNQPSTKANFKSTGSFKNISIQCSSDDLDLSLDNDSDKILIGRASAISSIIESRIQLAPGFNERGVQVDFNQSVNESATILFQTYSDRLSRETIEHFLDVCQGNVNWARSQIENYLKNRTSVVPTLRQLALNALDKWNEQIKMVDPTFDSHCLDDLLEDINDEEISEDFMLQSPTSSCDIIDNNSIQVPWSLVDRLQDLYGDLGENTLANLNQRGVVLSVDDDLALNLYQALQRLCMKNSNQESSTKPVHESQKKKSNKNKANQSVNTKPTTNTQRWTSVSENPVMNNIQSKNIPSLKQIIEEEQRAFEAKKSKPKNQLDYASEYKLKELERLYPSLGSDLIYDIFRENEFNYEITLACICSMLDDDITLTPKDTPVHTKLVMNSTASSKPQVEPVVDSYETLRSDTIRYAQKRKEFYTKAQQANRHGMAGVASYYIHQASEQTRLMKNANRAACERLSRWRLAQFYQTHKLDLHGLHADEALQLFKQVEQDMNEGNRRTTPKSIQIITGYGKGSIYGGGYGKLRSAIVNYIQQKHYKYSEPNRGVILVEFSNN